MFNFRLNTIIEEAQMQIRNNVNDLFVVVDNSLNNSNKENQIDKYFEYSDSRNETSCSRYYN